MIFECNTLKDCREALYRAYGSESNLVLDLGKGIDADKVPVIVGACTNCNADKVLETLGMERTLDCPVCGSDMDRDHVVNMMVQGDVVVYRWQDDFGGGE
jgi:hypothetical protein